MRLARLVLVVALSAIMLSACGSTNHTIAPFIASTNCKVSVTNVDYAGCNLEHQDFRGLDLASDNFRRANLSYADLDGANLQGADVRGARSVGVMTNGATVCVNATFGPCRVSGLRGT